MSEEAKPKKNRNLTPKQKKLVKAMQTAESIAEAGEIAGYSDRTAASRALTNLQEKMPDLMNRLGLTDEAVVNKYLLPGMDAMETKLFADKGIVLDTRDVIAWGERRGYLDMFFKLKGSYAKGEPAVQVNVNHNTLHIDVMTKGEDDLRAILRLATGSRPDSGGGESRAV